MKIINLMENTPGSFSCLFEHGLCMYIETKKHKVLVDTGSSDKTWENAKIHSIDLSKIDTVFLSHGHYDHAGGLMSFEAFNSSAQIYLHKNGGLDYYSISNHKYKYIGIDKAILKLSNLHLIDKDTVLDEELSVFTNVTEHKMWPDSNFRLKKKVNEEYIQDVFDHEQYVVIQEEGKSYLFSGCAHNGIINILNKYKEIYHSYPDYVFSGFHMMKKLEYTEDEIQLIKDIANELKKMDTIFYTGHCTGIPAFNIMKEIMQDQLNYMHSGDILLER